MYSLTTSGLSHFRYYNKYITAKILIHGHHMIEKVLRHYLLLKTKARYEAQARPTINCYQIQK
jgi:hypothetical protein